MQLREKLVRLRGVAGERRGLGRPMTQTEVAEALRVELGQPLSQAYLSQLERGKRVHLSNTSRETLARFFQVHPGYLVSDLADASTPLLATESLSTVPGLALAHDLIGPLHDARKPPASTFPARSYPTYPLRVAAEQARIPCLPGVVAGVDGRLNDLLSRMRDHPQAERVLLLMEHILRLPPPQLSELERLLERSGLPTGWRGHA